MALVGLQQQQNLNEWSGLFLTGSFSAKCLLHLWGRWVGGNPFWWTVGELNLQSRQAGWANEYSIGASQAQLVLGRLFGVGVVR